MPRVAAIDVGSNAIRLLMVELSSAGKLLDTDFQRYPVRLGTGVFSRGRLSEEEIETLVGVFCDIAQRMSERGVERYRAVGTAAMREAANREEIVERIERTCGVALEIIDGREESRLSRNALWRAVGWAPGNALLFDLGGGTIELERANRRTRISLPLGTVRLLEIYPQLIGPLTDSELWRLVDDVGAELGRLTRLHKPAPIMIGTGGNLASLAQIIPAADAVLPTIDVRRLPELMVEMAGMTVAERVQAYPLRPDRAELVIAGTVVLAVLIRRFGVETFVVPGTGLRESMLHELTAPPAIAARVREVSRRLGQRPAQAEARARVARQLFEVTVSVHGLWPPALAPLLAAAYLSRVGESIDPERAAEHTAYVIRHAAGLGLDDRSREIAARTAQAAPNGANEEIFAGLNEADAAVARSNAALLRLALAITDRKGRSVRRANTLRSPLTIECGVDQGLPREVIAEAERALACTLEVI